MPRNYERKTKRGLISIETWETAINACNNGLGSIREVAEAYELCHTTLSRKIIQKENGGIRSGYKPASRVFTNEEEKILEDYLVKSSQIFYGFSTKDCRKLAYELVIIYNIKHPKIWDENESAGIDWLYGYMKRHPKLTLRCPESTSLARATSFNPENVGIFFSNLKYVMDKHSFEPHSIYNMDETGVTTVQTPNRVIAEKGTKIVGGITSGERGTLVTVIVAVSAIGILIPPMFVFPRKKYHPDFVKDGPAGCVGVSNGSGWCQKDEFCRFLSHFATHTRCSKENKVLLLLDNHQSHISLPAIDYCNENGIVMLSFPPHCTHKMQPLDKSVFRSFKYNVNNACDNWMRSNPGRKISIYDIPGIVNISLPTAANVKNIQAGFASTGIYPLNDQIFDEIDFMPSTVNEMSAEKQAPYTSQEISTIFDPSQAFHISIPSQIIKCRRKKKESTILTNLPTRMAEVERAEKSKIKTKNHEKLKLVTKTEKETKGVKNKKKCFFCFINL